MPFFETGDTKVIKEISCLQVIKNKLRVITCAWHASLIHVSLAEVLSAKKQESYATTISWVRAKVSFAILRSALLCLRESRTPRRRKLDVKDRDLEIEKGQAVLP